MMPDWELCAVSAPDKITTIVHLMPTKEWKGSQTWLPLIWPHASKSIWYCFKTLSSVQRKEFYLFVDKRRRKKEGIWKWNSIWTTQWNHISDRITNLNVFLDKNYFAWIDLIMYYYSFYLFIQKENVTFLDIFLLMR